MWYFADVELPLKQKILDDALVLSFDRPGVAIEDVVIEADGRYLTVRTARDGKLSTASYKIAEAYDLTAATASLKNGVLVINVPKLANHIRRKIEVTAG